MASASRQLVGPVTLHKINARFNTVDRTVRVGDLAGDRPGVALGAGLLWVAPQYGLLTRVDPRGGSVLRPAIDPGHHTTGIAVGAGAVWLAGGEANTVTRVDVASGHPTPIPVGNGPADIGIGSARRLGGARYSTTRWPASIRRPESSRRRSRWADRQRAWRSGPGPCGLRTAVTERSRGSTRTPTRWSPRSRSAQARRTSRSPPAVSG